MDYEDLDSVLDRRNVSWEQSAKKPGYNEHNTSAAAAASFDVHGLKAYETQHDVGARKGFSSADREIEASPRSDVVSVVYARVNRANKGSLSSSSQQTDESNQFQHGQVDRNPGYDVQRDGNEWQDNKTSALYSTVQRKLDQPVGYSSYGSYDAGFGDATSNSCRRFEPGYGNASCETNVDSSGIYSFINAESPGDAFHSTVHDAGLGSRFYPNSDRGIYELEQPVVTPRSGGNIHNVNTGYQEFHELHAGPNFGYGSRPFSTPDSNVYSFIRSDSIIEDEHLANSRGNGDAFLARDLLQIALG